MLMRGLSCAIYIYLQTESLSLRTNIKLQNTTSILTDIIIAVASTRREHSSKSIFLTEDPALVHIDQICSFKFVTFLIDGTIENANNPTASEA